MSAQSCREKKIELQDTLETYPKPRQARTKEEKATALEREKTEKSVFVELLFLSFVFASFVVMVVTSNGII